MKQTNVVLILYLIYTVTTCVNCKPNSYNISKPRQPPGYNTIIATNPKDISKKEHESMHDKTNGKLISNKKLGY